MSAAVTRTMFATGMSSPCPPPAAVPVEVAPGSVPIDHTAFPHILDEIIAAAPPSSLRALRATCRTLRARVDALMPTHLVVSDVCGESRVTVAGTGEVLPTFPGAQWPAPPGEVGILDGPHNRLAPSAPWSDNVLVIDVRDYPALRTATAGSFLTRIHTLRLLTPSHWFEPPVLSVFSARRLVVHATLPRDEGFAACAMKFGPPLGVPRLVFHITCDQGQPRLRDASIGLSCIAPTLEHVVVIFALAEPPPDDKSGSAATDVSTCWAAESYALQPLGLLRHIAWAPGVRYTFVGADKLHPACFGIDSVKGRVTNAELRATVVNAVCSRRRATAQERMEIARKIEYISLEAYRARLHPHDFALETQV